MDGMAAASVLLCTPDFADYDCLGPLFIILSALAEKWLITRE